MRVLFACLTTVATSSEEEVGLLQQRLSVGEGVKAEVDLDLDCRQGPKNCVKTTTTTTQQPTCADFSASDCPPRQKLKRDGQCAGASCTAADCCEPSWNPPTCKNYQCPAQWTERDNMDSIRCKQSKCFAQDCCETSQVHECRIWGDPQITSFDKLISARFKCNGKFWDDSTVDSYKDGDYYLLRSEEMIVQGRFGRGMGSARSMNHAIAVKVGDEVLQVRPSKIFYQDDECGGGLNKGPTSGPDIGKFKVLSMNSGMIILHQDVPDVKIWVQQVIGGAPAVQAIIFKSEGSLTDVSGLCGDGDGVAENDCTEMIGEVNKVEKQDSLFKAGPFEFAGCASASAVQWEWRTMGACSNADHCAMKCKGFGPGTYYPEFYVKKSVQFANQVDCFCANLEASQKTAWARFTMKPEEMRKLPKKLGTCSEEKCMSGKPMLGGNDYCVFTESEPAEPKECTKDMKMKYYKKCQADSRFEGNAVHQCVSDMCASDNPDEQEDEDGSFLDAAAEESSQIKTLWKTSFTSWSSSTIGGKTVTKTQTITKFGGGKGGMKFGGGKGGKR